MLDLTLQPFAIAFLVLAAVATVVALATIARVVVDVRQGRTAPVVSIGSRSAVAEVVGRAA